MLKIIKCDFEDTEKIISECDQNLENSLCPIFKAKCNPTCTSFLPSEGRVPSVPTTEETYMEVVPAHCLNKTVGMKKPDEFWPVERRKNHPEFG